MKTFIRSMALLLVICSQSYSNQFEKSELIASAKEYEAQCKKVEADDFCNLEKNSKKALIAAFKSCLATQEEIMTKVNKLSKVKALLIQCAQQDSGASGPSEKRLSLQEFESLAKSYQKLVELVSNTSLHNEYKNSRGAFLNVLSKLKSEGISNDEIATTLKDSSITNVSVLSDAMSAK